MTLSLILGRKYLSVEDGHFEVVTTAWSCIHTSDFPLLVLKISLYVSFHLLSCFMLSGKVAPPELKYLNMCISCDTWEAYAGHGLFVHATGKCGVVILLVCFRFHTGTYSRIYFFFFFFPPSITFTKSHAWENLLQLQVTWCCRAYQRVTAFDKAGACWMLLSFGIAASGKQTN